MKQLITNLIFVVSLVLSITSCASEANSDLTRIDNDSFRKVLSEYMESQRKVMNKAKAQTRSNQKITFDNLVKIACELDSISKAFYTEHPELIYEIKENITEDQLCILATDADSLQAFVDRNLPSDISQQIKAYFDGKQIKIAKTPINNTDDKKSATLKANIELSTELNQIVISNIEPQQANKTKREYCLNRYNKRIGGCQQSYYTNIAFATVCVAASIPTTYGAAAIATIAYGLAIDAYQDCLDDAYSSYIDCLK